MSDLLESKSWKSPLPRKATTYRLSSYEMGMYFHGFHYRTTPFLRLWFNFCSRWHAYRDHSSFSCKNYILSQGDSPNLYQRNLHLPWVTQENNLWQGYQIHFKFLDRFILRLRNRVTFQHCLSSPNWWPNRTYKSGNWRYAEGILHAWINQVDQISIFSRVCL